MSRGRPQGVLKRQGAIKQPKERVLIVSEGSKTEPTYFNEMRDSYELSTASVRVTGDCGSDPLSVVRYGEALYQKEKRKGDTYDRVFCVFDRDSHATYADALARVAQMRPKGVFVAIPSIPCFEYWYLLHYQYTTQQFERAGVKSPADCLIALLKKEHWHDYQKAKKGIFLQLVDKLPEAILRSRRALADCEKNQTDHPSTLIHEVVEYLQGLKQES